MQEERQNSMEKWTTILDLARGRGGGGTQKDRIRNQGGMKKVVGRQGRLHAC